MSDTTRAESALKNKENKTMATPAQLEALPCYYRETIPPEYIDPMGHMNVRWYMALYDQATWYFFEAIGMNQDYFKNQQAGAFALKHFLSYFSEIHEGQTVAIRSRVLGRTDKRFHFMHFMINESTARLASCFEALGTHADLRQRRSAPFPPSIADAIDNRLNRDSQLDWQAPVCGILNL